MDIKQLGEEIEKILSGEGLDIENTIRIIESMKKEQVS